MDTFNLKPNFEWDAEYEDGLFSIVTYKPVVVLKKIVTMNVVTVNLRHSSRSRVINKAADLDYFIPSKVHPEVFEYIKANWDKDIPLHIWCEIQGLTKVIPTTSWGSICTTNIFSKLQRF